MEVWGASGEQSRGRVFLFEYFSFGKSKLKILFEKCVGPESSSGFWWWCPAVGARLSWSWWLLGDVLVPLTEDEGLAE
jgi:hypothetical protein